MHPKHDRNTSDLATQIERHLVDMWWGRDARGGDGDDGERVTLSSGAARAKRGETTTTVRERESSES